MHYRLMPLPYSDQRHAGEETKSDIWESHVYAGAETILLLNKAKQDLAHNNGLIEKIIQHNHIIQYNCILSLYFFH